MQQETMDKMKSYPGFPVLLAMMDKNYSSLTIDTAVNTMVLYSNPQQAAKMLMDYLQKPGATEQKFWRFLQDQMLPKTVLKNNNAQTLKTGDVSLS